MNWLLIIVLIILAAFIWEGYHKGFIRIVFSLVAFLLTFSLATAMTPQAVTYIEEETTIADQVTDKCLAYIEKKGQEKIDTEAEIQKEEAEEQAKEAGIELPSGWMDKIMDAGSDEAGEMLEESGVYQAMAEKMAHFIVSGLTFFILLILITLILNLIIRGLDIVAKLPGLKGVNHLLGMLAGFLKGIFIIWLLMFLLSIFATGSFGLLMTDYINRSKFLSFLYEFNPVLWILLNIF